MNNELSQQVIRYDGAGYAMKRAGEGAKIPLSAHYIRLSSEEALRAGAANGRRSSRLRFLERRLHVQ
ncbi:hypothetical protein [Pseudomonas synxantha]|uniref:hypothetical protein n=1 Tax=Pseudomonas synxantha TaxID=47883 RepID=UPI0012FB5FEA|nr:hypothetical protein [Pseudomonas synxantha]